MHFVCLMAAYGQGLVYWIVRMETSPSLQKVLEDGARPWEFLPFLSLIINRPDRRFQTGLGSAWEAERNLAGIEECESFCLNDFLPHKCHSTWYFNTLLQANLELILFFQGSPGSRGPPGGYGEKGFPGDPVSFWGPGGSELRSYSTFLVFFPLVFPLTRRETHDLGGG